jgi:hypothetical protein
MKRTSKMGTIFAKSRRRERNIDDLSREIDFCARAFSKARVLTRKSAKPFPKIVGFCNPKYPLD